MSERDLRPIQAARDAADSVREQARSLIPWLPQFQCDACGTHCDADVQYVDSQAMPVAVWDCPECDRRFHRDEGNPLTADMW